MAASWWRARRKPCRTTRLSLKPTSARTLSRSMEHNREMDTLLEVSGLEVAYAAVQVVWGVDLKVGRGQVVTVIGPNGAGKTTTLRSIAALVPPKKGRIIFDGQDITGEPAHERVRHRLCLVPEGRHLWPNM